VFSYNRRKTQNKYHKGDVWMIKIEDCREEVKEFACFMEEILRKHDDSSWKNTNQEYLFNRLSQERDELLLELYPIPFQFEYNNKEKIQHECGDVANLAMMIWDVSR
jgi:hypothetical protein